MASLNKVILIGNLGADPETRYTTSGDAVCNIRLATTDTWRDKASGEQREATEWHRVVFYRRLAEIAWPVSEKGLAGLHRRSHQDPQMAGRKMARSVTRPKSKPPK